jgi:hypothetical protein
MYSAISRFNRWPTAACSPAIGKTKSQFISFSSFNMVYLFSEYSIIKCWQSEYRCCHLLQWFFPYTRNLAGFPRKLASPVSNFPVFPLIQTAFEADVTLNA